MEQMMTALSFLSRMTSSSNSFQPSRDSSMRTAEGETGAYDQRETADFACDSERFLHRVRGTAFRQVEPDIAHGFLEQFTVFRTTDDFGVGADHFNAVTVENARIVKFESQIESGLASERREDCVGAFTADDFMQDVFGKRFDVSAVREIGVCHDRRGIAVDQNDFVPFLFERLAGLGSGVIEFAGLSDDDWPRPDQHDFLDVVSFWHNERSNLEDFQQFGIFASNRKIPCKNQREANLLFKRK